MKKAIVNFYELSEVWQAEAKRNLDEFAEETMYLEPDENSNPEEHVLWDLSECMRAEGTHNLAHAGPFYYNATMAISNNSAMLLNVSDTGEEAEIIFV